MPWWNPWPRERADLLAHLWPEGWSFTELAIRINDECGTCFSRSAIAGKVNRMQLKTIERERRPSRLRAPRKVVAVVPAKPVKQEPAPRVPLKPRMIDILELKADTCRYPYGDLPPFRYCGCPILKGSPYCRDHTAVCWNHPPLEL